MLDDRHPRADGFEPISELGVVHDDDAVGVLDEIGQLIFDVAEVDVDRHGAQLEGGQHGLDPGHAVVRVDADVVTGADAEGGEPMRDLVCPALELGIGEVVVSDDECGPIRHTVGRVLEEIGDVVRHEVRLEQVPVLSHGHRGQDCSRDEDLPGCGDPRIRLDAQRVLPS